MEVDELDQSPVDMYDADLESVNKPIESGDIDIDDDNNEHEEEMTCAQALQTLENAWLNEKFAPELLPHQQDLIDFMLETITNMEDQAKK